MSDTSQMSVSEVFFRLSTGELTREQADEALEKLQSRKRWSLERILSDLIGGRGG